MLSLQLTKNLVMYTFLIFLISSFLMPDFCKITRAIVISTQACSIVTGEELEWQSLSN